MQGVELYLFPYAPLYREYRDAVGSLSPYRHEFQGLAEKNGSREWS